MVKRFSSTEIHRSRTITVHGGECGDHPHMNVFLFILIMKSFI